MTMDVEQLTAQIESGDTYHTVTIRGTVEELLVFFGERVFPDPEISEDVEDVRQQLLMYLEEHNDIEEPEMTHFSCSAHGVTLPVEDYEKHCDEEHDGALITVLFMTAEEAERLL